MTKVCKRFAVALVAVYFASGAAFGAEPCNPNKLTKSGTLTAHATSVGCLVSVHWGDGVLTLNNGETHNLHIVGGKLIETGLGETHLKAEVYNLETAEDFGGVYYGSASESALI